MRYITDTTEFCLDEPTIVTLGKFDGRHRGHEKLLGVMAQVKKRLGYATAVLTFGVTPVSVISGGSQQLLTTGQERRKMMEQAGIDYLVEYPFTEKVMHMEATDFVKKVLVDAMKARAVVVGTDCGFGYQRRGNTALLRELAPRYGFELYVVEKEKDADRDISSTYIREELERGNIRKANELLGRPFSVEGSVVHGRHLGGTVLGFPTANLVLPSFKCLPRLGVYASRVLFEGKWYCGVTNIGRKPTVEGENPLGVETYIFDLNRDLYGKEIQVQLLEFIRPEQRFPSLDELKEQIGRDKETAELYFKKLVYKQKD